MDCTRFSRCQGNTMSFRKTPKPANRRGAAAVELAVVLPIFILMVFGIIEFGRAIMVHQILVNASREAARYAVVPNATQTVMNNKISQYMTAADITGYTTGIQINGTVGTLASAASDDEIRVVISVPYSNVSWGIMGLIDSGRTFSVSTIMRKE